MQSFVFFDDIYVTIEFDIYNISRYILINYVCVCVFVGSSIK